MTLNVSLSEIGWMRGAACFFIVIVTVALGLLNVSGAWIVSGNIFYTLVVAGVEGLAALCLTLILAAPTVPRKIVGCVVFAGLLFVCIENGKIAVQEAFKGDFAEAPSVLRDRADLAEKAADNLDKSTEQAIRDRDEEMAALKVEQDLMASDTRIEEAQTRLISLGLYDGRIDGKRESLTEDAMRKRGETIRKRLEVLQAQKEAGASPAEGRRIEALNLNQQADEVERKTIWMYLLLLVVEGARSAGLWAFVIWADAKRTQVDNAYLASLVEKASKYDKARERDRKNKTDKKNTKDGDFEPAVPDVPALPDLRADKAATETIEVPDPEPEQQDEPEDLLTETPDGDADGNEAEPEGGEPRQEERGEAA